MSTNAGKHTSNLGTFTNDKFKQLEYEVAKFGSKFGFSSNCTKYKGSPLSMEIHNAILTKTDKELELERFTCDEDPISHLQGYEYIMELRCRLNYQF